MERWQGRLTYFGESWSFSAKIEDRKESWKRVGVLIGPFTEGNMHWYKRMFKEEPETIVRII
jgi:hypothetical protein